MAQPFNPLDYPTCLMPPAWASESAWVEHIPFVFALVEMLRPGAAAGLGDPTGVSYCALCQAIDRLGLPCRAVSASVLDHGGALQAHHDPRYGRFSSLLLDSVADVLSRVADQSLDLVLLTGPPHPNTIHGDFENCLPKLGERGVLVLHGIGVAEEDGGARALWADVRARYPSLEFPHGRGLGVLAVGARTPAALGVLASARDEDKTPIQEFYYQLGRRISRDMDHRRLGREHQDLLTRLAETEQLAQVYRLQSEECDALLRRANAELEPIQRSLALRCVRLLARMEWALAPAGSRWRRMLHSARRTPGALFRRRAAAGTARVHPAIPPGPHPDPARPGDSSPAMLMVTHYGGGGTGRHVRDMAGGLEREGVRVLLLSPADGGRLRLERFDGAALPLPVFDLEAEYYTLLTALKRLGVVHVHVQHLLGHPPQTRRLVTDLGLPYDLTLHDYHYACPRIHLHDRAGRYCGEPSAPECNACLARNGDFLGARGPVTIDAWRAGHAEWLAGARRVFVPHAEVGRRMSRYFPHVRFHERPHPERESPVCSAPPPQAPGEPLRVGLLGLITAHKGLDVLMECAGDAAARRLPLFFQVIGSIHPERPLPNNMAVSGEYEEDRILDLIRSLGVHCALFLSLVPETYSFTLSIAQAARLYPLGFDLGAIGARIRESGWGEVFPLTTAAGAINDRLVAAAARLGQGVPPPFRRYESLLRDYYDLDWAGVVPAGATPAPRGRAA